MRRLRKTKTSIWRLLGGLRIRLLVGNRWQSRVPGRGCLKSRSSYLSKSTDPELPKNKSLLSTTCRTSLSLLVQLDGTLLVSISRSHSQNLTTLLHRKSSEMATKVSISWLKKLITCLWMVHIMTTSRWAWTRLVATNWAYLARWPTKNDYQASRQHLITWRTI